MGGRRHQKFCQLSYTLVLVLSSKALFLLKSSCDLKPPHSFVITSLLIKESVSYFISFVDNLCSLHHRPNIFSHSQLV